MVKIEEWSDSEIAQACSFTHLINRIQDNLDDHRDFTFENRVHTQEEFEPWVEEFREVLLNRLKIKDLLENRGEISIVKGNSRKNANKSLYTIEHFYLKSWEDTLIPVLLCRPKNIRENERVPAIVCAHGHVENKEILVGRHKRPTVWKSTYSREFAKMGCITITMDQRGGFGEQSGSLWKLFLKQDYEFLESKNALKLLLLGRTMNGLRYFDAIRQVDYLLTRDDVDPNRIGTAGLSLGGATAGWVAALDPRVKLAVIAGYLNTFKSSFIALKHCPCDYIPGMGLLGDFADVYCLIAPRPVCFIMGIKDNIFPYPAAQKAFTRVQNAYDLLGVKENCILDTTPYGHGWRGDIAYPWVKQQFFHTN